VPPSSRKIAYGTVTSVQSIQLLIYQVHLYSVGSVIDIVDAIANSPVYSTYPMSFEELDHPYGYVLYETIILHVHGAGNLSAAGIKDRGYVMIDGVYQVILQ